MDWNERYNSSAYLFGKEPSQFLIKHAQFLSSGRKALCVADGEGRNGVWLAEQGIDVHAIDGSSAALEKANLLAAKHGVTLKLEQCDVMKWHWPEAVYDYVIGIFIQFSKPPERDRLFAAMKNALKPNGLIFLHGYTPQQLEFRTGGPSEVENLYTEELLRQSFHDYEIITLQSYVMYLSEGTAHVGASALIDLVARKRL